MKKNKNTDTKSNDQQTNPQNVERPQSKNQEFSFILDIPLELSVELGKAQIPVSDFLSLNVGSVIELNKLAGEPMEILINRKLMARGEIVVIKEKLGVRLTDIITPIERIRNKI